MHESEVGVGGVQALWPMLARVWQDVSAVFLSNRRLAVGQMCILSAHT